MTDRIHEARSANRGGLCIFREGNYYHLYYEDAEIGARTLGLVLTNEQGVPVTGFGYWTLGAYVGKLTAEGYRVAVIEE